MNILSELWTSLASVGSDKIFGVLCIIINSIQFIFLESSKESTFEQLCINYTNETIQQLFVELVLKDEKKWFEYDESRIDVPFFDNIEVLGKFIFFIIIFCKNNFSILHIVI